MGDSAVELFLFLRFSLTYFANRVYWYQLKLRKYTFLTTLERRLVRMERRESGSCAPAREGFLLFLWAIGYHLSWFPAQWLALPWWASLMLPVCWLLALIRWCFTGGRAKRLFLTVPRGSWHSLWPLALFPGWNLLWGGFGHWEASRVAPVLLAAIAEEFFFRGVLLSLWERAHTKGGIFVSALVFAAYHLLSPDSSGIQALCALTAGVCYGEATLRTGSLVPAMLAHLAVNLTGTQRMDAHNVGLWLCTAVCMIWGAWGASKRRKDMLCNFT